MSKFFIDIDIIHIDIDIKNSSGFSSILCIGFSCICLLLSKQAIQNYRSEKFLSSIISFFLSPLPKPEEGTFQVPIQGLQPKSQRPKAASLPILFHIWTPSLSLFWLRQVKFIPQNPSSPLCIAMMPIFCFLKVSLYVPASTRGCAK